MSKEENKNNDRLYTVRATVRRWVTMDMVAKCIRRVGCCDAEMQIQKRRNKYLLDLNVTFKYPHPAVVCVENQNLWIFRDLSADAKFHKEAVPPKKSNVPKKPPPPTQCTENGGNYFTCLF